MMNEVKNAPSVVGPLIALIIGVFFGCTFLNAQSRKAALKKDGVETEGTIVELLGQRMGGGLVDHPVIEFADADGVRHCFKASRFEKNAKLGMKISVTYSRSNPKIATIDPDDGNRVSALVAALLFAYSAFGFYLFFAGRKLDAVGENPRPTIPPGPGTPPV